MSRFVRATLDPDIDPIDEPFDEGFHRMIEAYEGGYPLELCFRAAEEALRQVNPPDFEIEGCQFTLIQHGAQLAIFQAKSGDRSVVVGVSRYPMVNEMTRLDHEGITQMRQTEIAAQGSDGNGEPSTFPRHFGACQTALGPYAWVSEFSHGYREINMMYKDDPHFNFNGDITERRIVLNGLNQGKKVTVLDVPESEGIAREVVLHQLRTAERCERVLAPSFRAGDYMYDPDRNRLLLQCYRAPKYAEHGMWALLADHLKTDVDRRLLIVALQLLSMISTREENLIQPPEGNPRTYFTYSTMTLVGAVSSLRREEQFFTPEEWNAVFQLAQQLTQFIRVAPLTDFDRERLASRVQFLRLLPFIS